MIQQQYNNKQSLHGHHAELLLEVLLEVNKLAEWLLMNFCVHDLARANARSWPFIVGVHTYSRGMR